MPELLLGLDVGTTSAKALIVDLAGQTRGFARRALLSRSPSPGRAEQDAAETWRSVQAVIGEALAGAGLRATDLAAVGVTTQRASVVVWDRATGEPLAPMLLWSDLRGAERAEALRAAGFLAPPLASVAKLEAALALVEDGRRRAAAGELCWGPLDSYLTHRLTAGAVHQTDLSNAWATCYLDLATMRGWNEALIEHQGLPLSLFPCLCESVGPLATTATSTIGAEVPIGAILADQQSGMLAHALWQKGGWKCSYGTSATLIACTGATPLLIPGLNPQIQLARSDEILFAVEGMVNSAGSLIDWLWSDLGLFDSAQDLIARGAPLPDAGGVAIRPALQGLGAPHQDTSQRAAIAGLSRASTKDQIARAALESISFRVREIAEAYCEGASITPPPWLPVDGGLSASDDFVQVHADLLGVPMARHVHAEATALGACIGAGLGRSLLARQDVGRFARYGRRFEPTLSARESLDRFSLWKQATRG